MAVVDFVGLVDRRFRTFIKDIGTAHIFRKETDIDLHPDELHGNIIGFFEDGYSCIISYFASYTIIKTVV